MIFIFIKIVDPNTPKGLELKKRVLSAASKVDGTVTIINVNKMDLIQQYNVKSYPSLIINEKVTVEGKLLTTREIVKLMKTNR